MVLLRVSQTAVCEDGAVTGRKAGLGREELGRVACDADGVWWCRGVVVQLGGVVDCELGGLEIHVG